MTTEQQPSAPLSPDPVTGLQQALAEWGLTRSSGAGQLHAAEALASAAGKLLAELVAARAFTLTMALTDAACPACGESVSVEESCTYDDATSENGVVTGEPFEGDATLGRLLDAVSRHMRETCPERKR